MKHEGQYVYSQDMELRLGPNCYWNNWLTSLQFHGISEYALAFVNFGCVYTGGELAEFIENEDDETIRWIFEAVHILDLPFSVDVIQQAVSPLLLTLDIYPLGICYPAYLQEHELHIINVCGIEKGYYRIADNHYGYFGLVNPATIDEAVSSNRVEGCGRLLMLKPVIGSAAEERTLLNKWGIVIKRKIEHYLDGVYLPDLPYPGGVHAISRLKDELPTLLASHCVPDSPQNRRLTIRLNQYFRFPREGVLQFFRLHARTFGRWIPNDFLDQLAISAELMRKIILKVLVAQMGAQPLQGQLASLQTLLQELEETEWRIADSLRSIHRSIP